MSQFEPAHFGDRKIVVVPIHRGAIGMISHQPGSVCQLHDRMDLMKSGDLGLPADFREPGQIHVVAFIAKRDGARRSAKPGPTHAADCLDQWRCELLNLFPRRAIQFQPRGSYSLLVLESRHALRRPRQFSIPRARRAARAAPADVRPEAAQMRRRLLQKTPLQKERSDRAFLASSLKLAVSISQDAPAPAFCARHPRRVGPRRAGSPQR